MGLIFEVHVVRKPMVSFRECSECHGDEDEIDREIYNYNREYEDYHADDATEE